MPVSATEREHREIDDCLRRVRAGETAAFEPVVRRFQRPLRAWLAMLTEVPPGAGKGLQLEFRDQTKREQKEPALVRLTDANKESWGQGPAAGGPDGFRILGNGRVARVTGEIEAYQTGWHAFTAEIYPPKTQYKIAGIELGRFSYKEVYMEAGKRYPVEILYDAERTHPSTNQGIRLKWATPRGTWPGAFTPIPVSQLHAPVQSGGAR